MFRTLSAGVLKTVVAATGHGSGWNSSSKDVQDRLSLHYVIAYLEKKVIVNIVSNKCSCYDDK